jgi:hypothetical protein
MTHGLGRDPHPNAARGLIPFPLAFEQDSLSRLSVTNTGFKKHLDLAQLCSLRMLVAGEQTPLIPA